MGFQVSSGSSRTPTALAEINVTPLVDVMLVLLIVFMVAAPMMNQGVQIELPKASAQALDDTPEQIVLQVNAQKEILFNGKKLKPGTLLNQLQGVASVKPQVQVFVQADKLVPYGFIAQVMAEVKKANIQRVGLVTQPGESENSL